MANEKKGDGGWVKRAAKIKEFAKKGDSIEGTLEGIEEGKQFGNKVFKIKDTSGELWAVFGTAVLETNMNGVPIGSEVKIIFTGEQPPKKKGQNPLKLFDVFSR